MTAGDDTGHHDRTPQLDLPLSRIKLVNTSPTSKAAPKKSTRWVGTRLISMLFVALMATAGCSDDEAATDKAAASDTGAGDSSGGVSDAGDTSNDTGTVTDDASGQDDATNEDTGTAKCPTSVEPPEVDTKRKKFALSLFHFNVEYVIGGLDYTDKSDKQHVFIYGGDAKGWDNDKVEDWIITETFAPMLHMYDKHPSWGVDIELQAYMIEVMADRHPALLVLLRKLAARGQVELISFHYAAQLFLAFSKEDHTRSLDAVRQIFKDHCLPLSGVVFNQEGQAGEGRQKQLVEQGYTIGVYPKNLWQYVQHERQPWPWYESEGGTLIVGPGSFDPAAGDLQLSWDFFDDGELRAVKKPFNPYFAAMAKHSPERVKEFEDQLLAKEKAGWHITTVSDYAAHLKAHKIEKKAAPPLIDGTWQAKSTDSIHRWLGGRSAAFEFEEEDNTVRTLNAQASARLKALQRAVDLASKQGKSKPTDAATMTTLWRKMWHAEVSDCSGVNPWRGEVLYGIETSEAILAAVDKLATDIKGRFAANHLIVDLHTNEVTPAQNLPGPVKYTPVALPFAVTVLHATRTLKITSGSVSDSPDEWRLTVAFGVPHPDQCKLPTAATDCDARTLAVQFPRYDDKLRYTPALIEDEVRTYTLADWAWQLDEAWLPLANGLIGLGPAQGGKQWWAIKHVQQVHVAARIRPKVAIIDFVDRAIQEPTAPTWVFTVFRGSEKDALALANRINTWPVVVL